MADVGFFYPPLYQRSPAGSNDSLGPDPVQGGGNGVVGKDGASTLTGPVPPVDSLGKDGDVFILVQEGQAITFYGQKVDGHWPTIGTSLLGARGEPGAGVTGGDGPPDEANVGPEGTLYFDRSSPLANLYQARA